MRPFITILGMLPSTLKALNDNPMACIVVVVLGAFALVAYVHK